MNPKFPKSLRCNSLKVVTPSLKIPLLKYTMLTHNLKLLHFGRLSSKDYPTTMKFASTKYLTTAPLARMSSNSNVL